MPPPRKKVKDQGEYDIYNDVTMDMLAKNFAKAITDLDTWKQKYPASDYQV
jgi:outer membrane protein assembly factor BamD (BamD/ComL family)